MKAPQHSTSTRCLLLALLGFLPFAAAPVLLASPPISPCQNQLSFRLWQETGELLTPQGNDIEVPSGVHAHLYIQVKGPDDKYLGATATIGYPGEFGFGGTAKEVLRHVRMEAQDAADRQYGRIRFTALAEGGAYLGYRIDDIDSPGQLSQLPAACRTGQVMIRVLPPKVVAPVVQAMPPREAAEQLVVLLYYGILRRRIVDQFDQGYVEVVMKQGRTGVELIAETLFESNEFRESAFRRAEERHGPPKRGGKSLTELLLGDMYSALYGRARPPQAQIQRELEDLDICLKGKAWHVETCGRLGRSLVASPLFYDQHKDLVDALVSPPETPQ